MGEFRIDDPGKIDRAGQAEKQLAVRLSEQGRTGAADVQAGAKAMSGGQWSGQLGPALSQGETEWGAKLDHVRKSLDATGSNLVQTAKNFRDVEGDNAAKLQDAQTNTDSAWAAKGQVAVLPDFI
jgi:hypothetical protein